MARVMSMVVVILLGLVVTTSPAKATDCVSVVLSLRPCNNFLEKPNEMFPGSYCCNAARNLLGLGDVDDLCQCLRQNPLNSGFLLNKARSLPDLCNLSDFGPLVKCLVPSVVDNAGSKSLLPPLIPGLPPLVPLPPPIPGPPVA